MKLGSIDFINSLPVDHALVSGIVPSPCEVVLGVPSRLNRMVSAGELDLSPVSSLHYAENASELLLLPDLSISSRSGVKSVLLFSAVPIPLLEGKTIGVTSAGKTTPALLNILLAKRYGVNARFVAGDFDSRTLKMSGLDALLLIGDEALLAAAGGKMGDFLVYDLAVEWTEWTGLPFVFAVWAVRKRFFEEHPALVREAASALYGSKRWGMEHPEKILRAAREKTNLDTDVLRDYFKNLRHDFGTDLKEGLGRYAALARELGLIAESRAEEEFADVGK